MIRNKKSAARVTFSSLFVDSWIDFSRPKILSIFCTYLRLRWSSGSVLAFSTQVCGFKTGRSRRIFRAKKILNTPSFGGEVKPSVPCRRFAACKRSLNLSRSRNLGKNYYRISFSPTVPHFAARISRFVADGGTWRLKWERLKAGESNGKLLPRTCPGCSVPEPYRSHDWALVPAKPGLQG